MRPAGSRLDLRRCLPPRRSRLHMDGGWQTPAILSIGLDYRNQFRPTCSSCLGKRLATIGGPPARKLADLYVGRSRAKRVCLALNQLAASTRIITAAPTTTARA